VTGASAVNPHFGWNIIADVRQLLEFQFMVNAYRAGTIVAVAAGALGWFMVLRRQAFAGHTLAIVSFPGAAAAILKASAPSRGLRGRHQPRSHSRGTALIAGSPGQRVGISVPYRRSRSRAARCS
jgi:hypothetical protein